MQTIKRYGLSIVIPAYREELRIKRCIEESLFFFRNNKRIESFEIIFVADKTGDRTIPIIRSYMRKNKEIRLIVNQEREQKGGSVRIGMLSAKFDLALFYDVDLSTPLTEVDGFLDHIDRHDILVASRGMQESNVQKHLFKQALSWGFSFLKRVLFNLKTKDTQCGFKMFKRKTFIIFEQQRLKTSHFDVEILFLAEKRRFSIKEIPVTWIDSDASNFKWYKQVPLAFWDLAKVKAGYIFGKYRIVKKPAAHGRGLAP